MRYKVPKFIDMEDKIIGPVTMRQLIMLAVGGGIAYGAYIKMESPGWLFVAIPSAGLAIAFAFVKIQNMTFFRYVLALTQYLIKPEKRAWVQHEDYLHVPKDLLKQKKKKHTRHAKADIEKLKKLEDYVRVVDEEKSDIVFEAFHGKEKGEKVSENVSKMKQLDTKSVQEMVENMKRNKPEKVSEEADLEDKSEKSA